MTPEMDTLIALSRSYGSNPAYVLAGGGNTSVKTADRLWVKASGCSLADVDESGFVEMDRSRLDALLAITPPEDVSAREAMFKEAIMAARIHPEDGRRPSVEAALHHLLPGTFVVHTHATTANMLTCCVHGEALEKELFGDAVLWVPYVDPGYTLSALVKGLLAEYTTLTGRACPDALLMEGHGLIVSGNTPDEIQARTDALIARIAGRLPNDRDFGEVDQAAPQAARAHINLIAPALRGLLAETNGLKIVTFDDSEDSLLLAGMEMGEAVAVAGPLTPDQIVYCKSFPLWFRPVENEAPESLVERLRAGIRTHIETTGFAPKVVIAQGLGLFAAGDSYQAADTVRRVYLDAIKVMTGAQALGGIRHMPKRDREFIDSWEVENYRRKVATGASRQGRAAGKIAVVTGAAQGFGEGIARDLAAEGAHVVLADINADGVRETAEALCDAHGGGRSIGVAMDVTQDASVAEALHQVVRRFGGFDLFVSNAGVLRAGSVKLQAQSEFEFVTKVNYTGYFLCVHNAAPILAIQHLARPEVWADIVQINSKSGLVGSNRNAAYAGGKFGGIGLTQSFALELVDDGIKVNSICPGNFFDGPLWSDPETGLFAQYLRTGKVPGAKSIDDVKRSYESKVPMRRGCTVPDVIKTLYYLIEQQYETGQALPVTGGQVMLR